MLLVRSQVESRNFWKGHRKTVFSSSETETVKLLKTENLWRNATKKFENQDFMIPERMLEWLTHALYPKVTALNPVGFKLFPKPNHEMNT